MKLLITIENLKEFRPIAKQIAFERITPYIQEAQQFDLKRLLGPPLYVDFMAKYDNSLVDPPYTNYQNLLKGISYTWNGLTYEHPGLQGYLSYMTLARFYNNNQVNATRYGIVQKEEGDKASTQVDWKVLAGAVAELRSNALALQPEIIQYLQANPSAFPLFNYQDGSAQNQLGVKFFDPDDPNYPGGSNGRTVINW